MIARIIKRLKNYIYLKIYGMNKYLIKQGAVIGENCHIYSNISTTETYLISIGDNTTISTRVQFITHDNSVSKVIEDASDVFGRITVGRNCFIGAGAIILPGVTIPDNTIVAAGSVVVKSAPSGGVIIGGNPARVIGDIKCFKEKMTPYAININGLSKDEKKRIICNSPMLKK